MDIKRRINARLSLLIGDQGFLEMLSDLPELTEIQISDPHIVI